MAFNRWRGTYELIKDYIGNIGLGAISLGQVRKEVGRDKNRVSYHNHWGSANQKTGFALVPFPATQFVVACHHFEVVRFPVSSQRRANHDKLWLQKG